MRQHHKLRGKEVAVAVGVGLALATGGVGLALATGAVALASGFTRRFRKPVRQDSIRRDEEGRLLEWADVLELIQSGGISPELRPELWPVLLGVFAPEASEDEQLAALAGLHRVYAKLLLVCRELEKEAAGAPAGPSSSSAGGGGGAGAAQLLQDAHRTIVMDALRTDFARQPVPGGEVVAQGGGEAGLLHHGSPTVTILPVAVVDGIPEIVLVNHPRLPPHPAAAACGPAGPAGTTAGAAAAGGESVAAGDCRDGDDAAPLWCSSLAADALAGATHVSEGSRRQMLRLINLLSAYAVHDPDVGYCQGMSDLASVFIQMFEDDALAFACFERLMRQARQNFKHDETGIKQQLQQVGAILALTDPVLYKQLCRLHAQDCMFAYRMVIVMLRRELSQEHAVTLWEMQWAREAATQSRAAAMRRQPSQASLQAGSSGGGLGRSSGKGGAAPPEAPGGAGAQELAGSTAAGGGLPRLHSASSGSQCGAAAQGGGDAAPPGDFIAWFIASVVRAQRRRVLYECHDTDDVLRLFNSVKIDFWATLDQTERRYERHVLGSGS